MKGTIESTEPLNEVAWWSSWTRTFKPVEGAYGLVSTEFEEPVFNRIVLLGPPGDPAELVKAASAVFAKEGSRPSFFIPAGDEYSELRRAVREKGFRSLGLFIVMEEKNLAATARDEVGVHEVSGDELEAWSRAYLQAFYGEQSLFAQVHSSVRRAKTERTNKLMVAEWKGRVAGTMALHTSNGCTGLYCLGTVPDVRGQGVASSLLYAAHEVSSRLGTTLVLQVFESDNVERFYLKNGYARLFSEEIFG